MWLEKENTVVYGEIQMREHFELIWLCSVYIQYDR